jgi:EAL domain-containing protein (putative c-di-GMP-specific phosphodiesterase class I)
MWNYSFEVPILMILGIILVFFFSRPRLPIRRNSTFLQMILIEALTIVIDVAASVTDNDASLCSLLLVNVLNMLYFSAFFFRAYVFYLFSVSVLKDTLGKSKAIRLLIRMPLFIGILMSVHSMVFGSSRHSYFIYYVDEAGYHSGAMYPLVYYCGFFYVLMSFICSYLYRNSLGRRREKYGMFLYNMIVFLSLVMRLAFPRFLIMDTFLFMAILVVYLAFVNPEYFLDLKAGAFNAMALGEYLEENIGEFKLVPLGIVIRNYLEMRDIYGYNQIDEGLVLIAKYLRQIFPKGIIFYCRNGQFVVLDVQGTDFDSAIAAIVERFCRSWVTSTSEVFLSAGFAKFDVAGPGYSSEVLLSTMNRALEKAGAIESEEILHVTDADIRQTEKEKMIRASIEAAIDHDGFELYLQPIVDATSGKVIGAEALSRIRDSEGKILPPGVFIPVAESNGRIGALGEIVFERTCGFIKDKGLEKLGIEWINVNLSPSQFIRTDLGDRFLSIAKKYDVDPSKVHLEITEGSMIDDVFLQKQIAVMGEKGFKFALDDYGTGYSNLSRLKKCPFINVKLDMSIVWDYCREQDAILPNMIQAFKHMGFGITAEGIEDAGMADAMKNIGCDLLQGYLYSKPVPADEFAEKYSEAQRA